MDLVKKTILLILIFLSPAFGGKYAGEFLYLGAGGRPLAMGGAYTASEGDVFSAYYNPAGLSDIPEYQAAFMHSETFGSLLNHDYLAFAKARNGGVAAFSLYRLGGGGILVTAQSLGRYVVVQEKSHADYMAGFSYGRRQSDRFAWGLTAKAIYRALVGYKAWDGVTLAAVMEDLTGTVLSYSNSTKETINPTLKLGLGLSRKAGDFKGTVLADADVRFEGRETTAQIHQGWVSADTHVGFEVLYKGVVAARVGSDIGYLTTGVGIKFGRFNVDLALFDHSDLDTSYRGSLIVNW